MAWRGQGSKADAERKSRSSKQFHRYVLSSTNRPRRRSEVKTAKQNGSPESLASAANDGAGGGAGPNDGASPNGGRANTPASHRPCGLPVCPDRSTTSSVGQLAGQCLSRPFLLRNAPQVMRRDQFCRTVEDGRSIVPKLTGLTQISWS